MSTYSFSATVIGLRLDEPEQLDRLHADALTVVPSETDGLLALNIEVEADSGHDAWQLFWAFLSRCTPEIAVLRLDEDLVTTSEIAVRLGVSRETPRTWAVGTRGDKDFPLHLTVVGQQRVWRWADVFAWAETHGRLPADEPRPLDADTVTRLNAQLLDARGESPPSWGRLAVSAH